jgi:hypothetical protein
MLWKLIDGEDGIGVVTALMVSFIVFALGATWYAVSVHELDEVVFDRNRTQSIHGADAGAREATYLLATPSPTVRDAADGPTGVYTSGIDGSGDCILTTLQSKGQQVGEYWFRITDATPADTEDFEYFIESWGWAPFHRSRQANAKKVELEVTLDPVEAFEYGLFADAGGISVGNRKEIYGDIYSATNILISQNSSFYDNGSFPGDGNLEAYGSLTVSSGASVYVAGRTTANGYIDDQHSGDTFVGDVIAVDDTTGLGPPGHDAYFKKATIGGVVRLGGTLKPGSDIGGAPLVENATGLQRVPLRNLPTFAWNAADYSPPGQTYATWTEFMTTYLNPNKTALSGAHYVTEAGLNQTLDLKDLKFAGDFVLVVDGSLELISGAGLAAGATPPLNVVVVANQASSLIKTGNNFQSTNDLRFLLYSKGQFNANNQTTIYGSVYANADVSSNQLTLHYRRPNKDIVSGFSFANDTMDVVPGVWREVPHGVDASGIRNPAGPPTYHCTLP